MKAGALALALSLVALASAGGCSVIVTGDVDEVKCTGSDATSCPSGLVCDPLAGRCIVAVDAAADQDTSDEDATTPSDEDSGTDADADSLSPPYDLGLACRLNAECKSGICGTSTMLTQPLLGGEGPICTKTCCTSGDCADGFVCFGAGTGGNYCVPAAKALRSPPRTGGRNPGATCSTNSACRSGACVDGRCLDTCCRGSDCSVGSTCQVASVKGPGPAHDTWVCAAPDPGATKDVGETCSNQANECTNNNCIGSPGQCRPSCCSRKDCWASGLSDGHCAYSNGGGGAVKFCWSTTTGTVNDGIACTADSDCKSAYCDPELSKCAQVCCQDADCKTDEVCRPSATGTPFLRCVSRVR